MHRYKFVRYVTFLIILFLSNCSPYLKRGNEFLQNGMVENAVAEYERGLQKQTSDPKLYLQLSYAQHLLAQREKAKAEENLENIADIYVLEDRQNILEKSLSLNDLAIKHYKRAQELLSLSNKNEAFLPVKFDQVQHYQLELGVLQELIKSRINQSQREIDRLNELATQNQNEEKWNEAELLYKKALSYHSNNERLKKLSTIAALMAEGIRYFNGDQFDQAKQSFTNVLKNDAYHFAAKTWISKCDRKKVEDLFTRAAAERNAGNLTTAIKLYKECMTLDENYPQLKYSLDATTREFAQQHHDKAETFEHRAMLHHAYMEYKNVIDYDGRKFFPSDYTKMEALKNKISNDAVFRIALVDQLGFGGGQITRNVSQGVVSKLFESESRKNGYIQILTREQLNQILHEQALSLSGVIDPNSVINTGGVKGVSYFVTIEVSYFDGDEYNSIVDSGEKKYVAYQKEVPNPEYVPPKDRKNSDSLFGAIEALAQELTPKYIKEDVYDFCRYEKIKYEAKAKMDISISIFSAETGEILQSEFIPIEKNDSDYEIRILSGDANKAGITRDNKNIKTKREMMEIVKDEGIQRAAQLIINKFNNIPAIYRKRGDDFLNSGNVDAAIENYVKAIVQDKISERTYELEKKVNDLLRRY